MRLDLPQTYLIGLSCLLLVIAILVGRQLYKTRKDEISLIKLEKTIAESSQDAGVMYELATVQLRKRLYPQAISTLKNALTKLESEPTEARALIENALGFALAAQDDFKLAIIHYKKALKAKSDYPVALNNLAFANQKLMEETEAYTIYQEVLKIDPKNKTANEQIRKIKIRSNSNSKKVIGKKGF